MSTNEVALHNVELLALRMRIEGYKLLFGVDYVQI
jgi:hypothetical protein